ncbi:methyltransferase domain-containing protein [bacterium]|nr:methyltransferase domain-containing protein [bacterium]
MQVYPILNVRNIPTYNPMKCQPYSKPAQVDTVDFKRFNPVFTGYRNLLKINPYEMLLNPSSANALEDYIRNGMFIHVKQRGNEKFGDIFWNEFLKLKVKFQNCTDADEIYTELRKVAENLSSVEELDTAAKKQVLERAAALGSVVRKLFEEHHIFIRPESVYLDIGCGNGDVAKSISNELGFSEKSVKGLEILERDDFCNIRRYKFDGQNIPKTFEKSDFVTVFNVLHHTKSDKEAKNLLSSAYENMNKDGILMIRDHNVYTPNDIKYWQVRHLLPIRVSKVDPPCLVQDTVYHSADEWLSTLRHIGFKPKFVKTDKKHDDIYSFYLTVQK